MTSPVSVFVTSKGIFSPRRMLLRFSVKCSWRLLSSFLYSSSNNLPCFLASLAAALSPLSPSFLEDIFTPITLPDTPDGTFSEESFTSAAFSPKMALSRRSSGASSVSLLGVILPTRISPGPTSAPTRITPSMSRSLRASSPRLGMSRVTSSGPSLVSRAVTSYSPICIDVKTSSLTILSLIQIASSKL